MLRAAYAHFEVSEGSQHASGSAFHTQPASGSDGKVGASPSGGHTSVGPVLQASAQSPLGSLSYSLSLGVLSQFAQKWSPTISLPRPPPAFAPPPSDTGSYSSVPTSAGQMLPPAPKKAAPPPPPQSVGLKLLVLSQDEPLPAGFAPASTAASVPSGPAVAPAARSLATEPARSQAASAPGDPRGKQRADEGGGHTSAPLPDAWSVYSAPPGLADQFGRTVTIAPTVTMQPTSSGSGGPSGRPPSAP